MTETRYIYFDLGNVLLFFDHSIASRNMAKLAGTDADMVHEFIFHSGLELRYEKGELTSQDFYKAFCEHTNSRVDFQQLMIAAADIFELNVRIVPILLELKRCGYRLGILSNTCEAHWRFITEWSQRFTIVRDLFDDVILSYEVKAMKPEPVIYQAATELANVDPATIFFTDDRPENVQGAIDYGWQSHLFTDATDLRRELIQRQIL